MSKNYQHSIAKIQSQQLVIWLHKSIHCFFFYMQSCHFLFACLLCCWLWPTNQVSMVTAWKTLWWEECQWFHAAASQSSEVSSDWYDSAVCTLQGEGLRKRQSGRTDYVGAAFTERESEIGLSYQEHLDHGSRKCKLSWMSPEPGTSYCTSQSWIAISWTFSVA